MTSASILNRYDCQRTGMIDASGSTAWEYDLRGRVTHEIKTVLNSLGANEELGSYHTYWSYNPDDSVRQMVYPNQETVNFRYNSLSQIDNVFSTVTDPNGVDSDTKFVDETIYDEAGRVRRRTLGNQVLQNFDYYEWTDVNGRGRLEQITAIFDGTSYLNLRYRQPGSTQPPQNTDGTPGYDTFGNITSILEFRQNSKTDPIVYYQKQSYTYDELDRLTSADVSSGDGPYSEETNYDSYGRLTEKGNLDYTYSEDHPHAVTTVIGGGNYQYDANGNMTSRVVDGVTYTLAYDSENRLISIHGGTVDAHYLYDGDGRRVLTVVSGARTIYIGDYFEAELGDGSSPTSLPALQNYPASLQPSQPARVFLPGVMKPQPAAQTTSGNHGTTLFRTHPVDPPEGVTWRSYYSAGGARVAEREILHPAGEPVSQQVFYLIADHLGSTTLITNQSGSVEGRNMYNAWGESRGTTGTLPTQRLYTGQLEDDSSNLYWYGSRWYDNELGRFIQPDTIVPSAGEGNNPYSLEYVADANYSALNVDYHENRFLYQLNLENRLRLAYPFVGFLRIPTNPIAFDRYAYAFNNPIRYNDPSGHFPGLVIAGVGLLGISPIGWVIIGVAVTAAIVFSVPEVRQATANAMANTMESLSDAVSQTRTDPKPWGLTADQEKLWGKAIETIKKGRQLPHGYIVSKEIMNKVRDMILAGASSVEAIADALADEIQETISKKTPTRNGPRHRNNRGENDEQ